VTVYHVARDIIRGVNAKQKWRSARKVESQPLRAKGAAGKDRRSGAGRGCEALADPDRKGVNSALRIGKAFAPILGE
jgi:hypothetical protein